MTSTASTRTVSLTQWEYVQACLVGIMRSAENLSAGRQHRHGAQPERAEEYSIRGAVGEAVVAKYLDRYWLGCGVLGGADVGRYQVRATAIPDLGVRLNHWDQDGDVFVSVHVVQNVGEILGWISGVEGKLEEYWIDRFRNGRPAYFVPRSALRPMEELPGA